MEIGIDSFVENTRDPHTGVVRPGAERIHCLLEEIELADKVGLDVFGIGEHHRVEYLASSPPIILAAAAVRTKRIRLASAVTVLGSEDPIRVFEQFAMVDLLSQGRAEIVVGRGSFIESFPLFGIDLKDYETLFAEKLDLLLQVRKSATVHWSGKHRAPLTGEGVYPRPVQNPLPVSIGVGGTPESFVRAGRLGLPLIVAIIGGEPHRFRPLVEMYRRAGREAGHPEELLKVGVHVLGFVGETTEQAANDFFPPYAQMFTQIGKERGWPPITRAQFDAIRGPTGALLIGDSKTVAEKILYINDVLGGVSRVAIQQTVGSIAQPKVIRAIELLGTEVAPTVRAALAAPAGSAEASQQPSQ